MADFKDIVDRIRWGRVVAVISVPAVIVIAVTRDPSDDPGFTAEDIQHQVQSACNEGTYDAIDHDETLTPAFCACLLAEMTTEGTDLYPIVERVGLFNPEVIVEREKRGEDLGDIFANMMFRVVLQPEYDAAHVKCGAQVRQ